MSAPTQTCCTHRPPDQAQIYNEEVRDLLGTGEKKGKLELKEDQNRGVYVKVNIFSSWTREERARQ